MNKHIIFFLGFTLILTGTLFSLGNREDQVAPETDEGLPEPAAMSAGETLSQDILGAEEFPLEEESYGPAVTLTGPLERGDTGTLVLIENPTSRSRVSWVLYGDPSALDNAREGDTVTVTGIPWETDNNPWRKHLLLQP